MLPPLKTPRGGYRFPKLKVARGGGRPMGVECYHHSKTLRGDYRFGNQPSNIYIYIYIYYVCRCLEGEILKFLSVCSVVVINANVECQFFKIT
jgi:hypothetical protein